MNKVLMIGPLPPLYHGMSIYMQSLLDASLSEKISLNILNTSVSKFFFEHREFRIILSIKFLILFHVKLIKFAPGIIHIHTGANVGFWEKTVFILLSKLYQKRVILHVHADFQDFYNKSKNKKSIERVLDVCDKIISLSTSWKTFFEKIVKKNKIVVIENGIDLRPFYKVNRNEEKIRILYAGLIGGKKGLYTIFEAIKLSCLLQNDRIQFDLLGESFIQTDYNSIVNMFSNEKYFNVNFRGMVTGEEKYNYFRKSDIFILPSFSEGLPLVLLEAMASYLPVISTKVGGIPDLIKEENGILIEPGDAKNLALALEKLINDKSLRESMGRNNREKVEKTFNIEIMLNKIINLYDNLILKEYP